MRKALATIYISLLCLIICLSTYASSDKDEKSRNKAEKKYNPGYYVVSIFKKYISPIDSDRCPSYPTCSSYSLKAFKKHGFIMGWLMTVDRLIHEGGEEKKISPSITVDGIEKIYDPVENNDFWWHKKPKEKEASK